MPEIFDEEKQLIFRAKNALMQYLNMSEDQAHHFILQQAMNLRQTKIQIAQSILEAYEA